MLKILLLVRIFLILSVKPSVDTLDSVLSQPFRTNPQKGSF